MTKIGNTHVDMAHLLPATRLLQIVFGLNPAYRKVVASPDAVQVLHIAAGNEDAGSAAWDFITKNWKKLVQSRGSDTCAPLCPTPSVGLTELHP